MQNAGIIYQQEKQLKFIKKNSKISSRIVELWLANFETGKSVFLANSECAKLNRPKRPKELDKEAFFE